MIKKVRFFIRKGDPGNPKGSEVVYIHNDAVARMFSGSKTSPKVSDIRFDDPSQEWVAYLRDGREIFRHKERDSVVSGEAKVIEGMFARGEYIPGGYMGVPRSKLPACISEPLSAHYKYLGVSSVSEYEFYTSADPKFDTEIVIRTFDCERPLLILSSYGQNAPHIPSHEDVEVQPQPSTKWLRKDRDAMQECICRARIERAIQEEETKKLSHHKDALK